MSHIDFDTPIDRMGSYCTQWDYVQDRFGKAGLLPFTISDMDFSAPDAVMKALRERLDHPVLGYSRWNHDDFKRAIEGWYQRRFDAQIDKDTIVYGPSVIYIIAKLIEKWSHTGDGVVFQTPAYDAFDKLVEGSGRRCIRNPLIKKEGSWEIDWDLLDKQLSLADTTIFLLCSPQNPTGRIWSREELKRIAEICVFHDVALISDEIHMDVAFKAHTPFLGFGMEQRWALVTSASKSFNIPALNGAYAFIPNEKARNDYLFKLKEIDGLSSPSILGVIGTMAAYNEGEDWLEALNEYVSESHNLVRTRLKEAFPSVDYQVPDATYLAWIDLSSLDLDMAQLQKDLIAHFNVAIMDGGVYGEMGQGYVRLNLGCSRSKVMAGLDALIGAIQQQ
ncbi:MalY/PatB family protein [Enterovibrio nigricans]|uniref:cysteine-S-conjugate beta-lyase n=1 Tax=Enterovibrio nigricans DSM 22720 TaxID=1121868 RepID=A0A1T4W2G8_9GAMM|nr:PatB family C-S lyase [Enterovibrio nigricans]PKF48993.1 putative C-S lyase [Enterovibrio nigricans]SKA71387.1 cystathione beta-lyase [Enterovibrio nigricans DSM 22720]